MLKWALLCDVSPAQIHSLVANLPLSPRLCELFRNLAQRSSLSRVVCKSWRVTSEECRTSFPWRDGEVEKNINRVHSFVILKGKLSLVSNDTIGHCCDVLHCNPCQGKITFRTKRMPTEGTSASFRNMIEERDCLQSLPRDKFLGTPLKRDI